MVDTVERPVERSIDLRLSQRELELVRAALRLLLGAEDDIETIRAVKALLTRLAEAAGR